MAQQSIGETPLVNSIVGVGTHFKGQLSVTGLLRVDGDFSGSIQTSGRVIIGRGGRADCTIDAATVVIGGVFRGTIYAREKVIALDTAIILGNIFAPRIVAETGVLLDGALHVRGQTARAPEEEQSVAPVAPARRRGVRRTPRGAGRGSPVSR